MQSVFDSLCRCFGGEGGDNELAICQNRPPPSRGHHHHAGAAPTTMTAATKLTSRQVTPPPSDEEQEAAGAATRNQAGDTSLSSLSRKTNQSAPRSGSGGSSTPPPPDTKRRTKNIHGDDQWDPLFVMTKDVKKKTSTTTSSSQHDDARTRSQLTDHSESSVSKTSSNSVPMMNAITSLEHAQAVAKAKLAASANRQQQQKKKNKRKRSVSGHRDDIFRTKRFADAQSNNNTTSTTTGAPSSRASPQQNQRRDQPDGNGGRGGHYIDNIGTNSLNDPNPFSRFLSSHPVIAQSLCFATPVKDSTEEAEYKDANGGNGTSTNMHAGDNSVVSNTDETLNTMGDETITSTLYYETTKLAGMSQKTPPMPLFPTFCVDECDEIHKIVATESHSSHRLWDLMYRQQHTQATATTTTTAHQHQLQHHQPQEQPKYDQHQNNLVELSTDDEIEDVVMVEATTGSRHHQHPHHLEQHEVVHQEHQQQGPPPAPAMVKHCSDSSNSGSSESNRSQQRQRRRRRRR